MPRIPQETVDKLNQIPLTLVMENNGYTISHRTESEAFYVCPFHNEKDASFKVDLFPKNTKKRGPASLPGFQCFGCGASGWGALMLQAALSRKKLDKDFRFVAEELSRIGSIDLEDEAVDSLAKQGNLVINGDHKNGFFHRARIIDAQDEFSFEAKDAFSRNDLRAIGCQVQQAFRRNWRQEGTSDAVTDNGEAVWKYSFEKSFYEPYSDGNNFDPKLLTERFNLYPVKSFKTEKRYKKDKGVWESHEVVSTDSYPIFVFRYEDKNGWWCRKYEPYFKMTEKSKRNYKFTWWYQNGVPRDEEMSTRMYGDVDVMRALATGEVESTDLDKPTMYVTVRENGNRNVVKKFRRIVICSGPRDAINVYFHSDAHVCFPHSETVEIPPKTIHALRKIAQEVFILYDIDETGRKRANRLAMRFLDLKVLYLPKQLSQITSVRTGKPCKDAEEYFNYYPAMLKNTQHFYGSSINEHFLNMLCNAKPMMFWKRKDQVRNKGKEDEFIEPKFTLLIDRTNQLLSACGMCKYEGGTKDAYANIGEDRIVDIMDEKQAFLCAKGHLKEYLANNRWYNEEGLTDTISDTRKLSLSTLQEISDLKLDLHSWGEDFDYLFFKDEAVRVTKDGAECVPYSKMPFHTNREAILQEADFMPVDMTEYFEIHTNPELPKMESEYAQRIHEAASAEDKKKLQVELNAYKRLWKYRVEWKKPMEEQPTLIQFIYDMGRVWWRDEESGKGLTEEKKQFHDMHFVNKIVGLGYMLSRYRTDRRQQMVTLTDYNQNTDGNASGRSGKSILMNLLRLVRKAPENIPGKQFQKDAADFAKNFADFTHTVHAYVPIDDLRADLKDESFYNLVRQLSVRNMYHDTFRIPVDESPKIIATMNKQFDVRSTSTYGRMWPMYACDYYHGETYEGDESLRSPETKFGYDVVNGINEEERNLNRNLMVYALQCYFQYIDSGEKGVIYPPVDKEAMLEMLGSTSKLTMFVDWAVSFFENPWHFERPIHLDELAISYMDYRDSLREKKEAITKRAVSTLLKTLKPELMRFCDCMKIVVNPDVVYSGDYDRSRGLVRTVAWQSLYDEKGVLKEPRERVRASGRCLYFYKRGNEPKQGDRLLDAPDKDMENLSEEEYPF